MRIGGYTRINLDQWLSKHVGDLPADKFRYILANKGTLVYIYNKTVTQAPYNK